MTDGIRFVWQSHQRRLVIRLRREGVPGRWVIVGLRPARLRWGREWLSLDETIERLGFIRAELEAEIDEESLDD